MATNAESKEVRAERLRRRRISVWLPMQRVKKREQRDSDEGEESLRRRREQEVVMEIFEPLLQLNENRPLAEEEKD